MKGRLTRRIGAVVAVPIFARLGFHIRRITGGVDRGFFIRLLLGLGGIVLVAALLVAAAEGPTTASAASSPRSAPASTGPSPR